MTIDILSSQVPLFNRWLVVVLPYHYEADVGNKFKHHDPVVSPSLPGTVPTHPDRPDPWTLGHVVMVMWAETY